MIENGGGYDDFVDQMLQEAQHGEMPVINAVDVSGHRADGDEELNEHVWYDLAAMEKLADQIAEELSKLDPDHAGHFEERAEAFKGKLEDLRARVVDARDKSSGAGVAITEPVPAYLLTAMGLANQTPPAFSEAIEEGAGVSPATLHATLELFPSHAVAVLVYNKQTTSPATDAVLDAAKSNGVPVVGVTETLPEGKDYVGWMGDNITNLDAALANQQR